MTLQTSLVPLTTLNFEKVNCTKLLIGDRKIGIMISLKSQIMKLLFERWIFSKFNGSKCNKTSWRGHINFAPKYHVLCEHLIGENKISKRTFLKSQINYKPNGRTIYLYNLYAIVLWTGVSNCLLLMWFTPSVPCTSLTGILQFPWEVHTGNKHLLHDAFFPEVIFMNENTN